MSKRRRHRHSGVISPPRCQPPTPAAGQAATSRPSTGLHISPAACDGWGVPMSAHRHLPLTQAEVRRLYGPPLTLGAPEEARMALDSQLEECGVYSLLQHSFAMGQMPQTQFLGYGTLQQIAQNGLIRACVETTVDDMTRNWIELKREGESPQSPRQEYLASLGLQDEQADEDAQAQLDALTAEMQRLKLQQVFHDAAALVGYMGGCLVYIDTGETDPEMLRQPLHIGTASAELKADRPLRFVPLDPINVFPGLYNSTAPLRAGYFCPRTWWVLGQEVHHSRLLRLVANEVPVLLKPTYNFLGMAQAQVLWDYVMHFQNCRVASERLLGKFSLTVMKTDMANVLTQQAGTAELDKRIALLVQHRSNDGVQVIDKEAEDIIKLETPLGGVTDIVRQALETLAAINRTPAVKLLGISPSGFNATGESDIRNYYDHILSQQEKVLRPALETVLRILQIRLFGKVDKAITFDFAALSEADSAALANTQKTKADTMAVLLDRQVVSPEECRRRLASDPDSGFSDIDADDLPEPPEEEMGGGMGAEMGGEPEPEPGVGRVDDVDKAGAVYGSDAGQDEQVIADRLGLDASRVWLFWGACDGNGNFKEGEHPRDDEGKFAATEGASSGPQDITELLGEEITGVKGKRAVEAILEKEGGHVKGAFFHPKTGAIDLFWGDETCGLAHIIKRRTEEGRNPQDLLQHISSTIANGTIKRDYAHETGPNDKRWLITSGKYTVSISTMLRGNKMTYVLTGFEDD